MKTWKIAVSAVAMAVSVTALGSSSGGVHAAASDRVAQIAKPAVFGTHRPKPTIVLVHGAFEDSSSWSGEVAGLQRDGYQVVVPAVPLRGVASDSAYVAAIVSNIKGPVVLVGHSYGGELITEVAAQDPTQVQALVYVAAFIPEAGETGEQLDSQFPGSLLTADTTYTISSPSGTDMYVKQADYRAIFAEDSSPAAAAVSAATQRPIAATALAEKVASGVPSGIPTYALVASEDKAIPAAAERFEADRASAKVLTVPAAHDVATTHPFTVTKFIEAAAHGW